MKDLGICQHLLSMSVSRTLGATTIGQQNYTETIPWEFGLKDCKPVLTLMELGWRFLPALKEDPRCDQEVYQ